MFNLQEIKKVDSPEFEAAWQIYEESYKKKERRSKEEEINCFNNSHYMLYAVECAGEIIGLLSEWEFKEFVFAEFFAIKRQARNKKVGSKVLEEYFQSRGKLVISEVNRPSTKNDAKRLGFLKRLGVQLNQYKYCSPLKRGDVIASDCFLSSYPHKVSKKEYDRMRQIIQESLF